MLQRISALCRVTIFIWYRDLTPLSHMTDQPPGGTEITSIMFGNRHVSDWVKSLRQFRASHSVLVSGVKEIHHPETKYLTTPVSVVSVLCLFLYLTLRSTLPSDFSHSTGEGPKIRSGDPHRKETNCRGTRRT